MPAQENVPGGGLRPATPFSAAHATVEKQVSVPSAAAHSPADSATAEPVLEPLGSRRRS